MRSTFDESVSSFVSSSRDLQLDLIIRDKNLNVANPSDTSTHDLLLSLMRIEKKSSTEVKRNRSKCVSRRSCRTFQTEKARPNPDLQVASTQSMLVTLEKLELNMVDNVELWCTLYDYSADDNGVELIPRFFSSLFRFETNIFLLRFFAAKRSSFGTKKR